MAKDLSKLNFDSTENYLKRSEFCNSQDVGAAAGAVVTLPINHMLGYVPFYEVFADIDNDGTIWNGNKVHAGTLSSAGGFAPSSATLRYNIDENQLRVTNDNSFTDPYTGRTMKIYWLIYLDYRNA